MRHQLEEFTFVRPEKDKNKFKYIKTFSSDVHKISHHLCFFKQKKASCKIATVPNRKRYGINIHQKLW